MGGNGQEWVVYCCYSTKIKNCHYSNVVTCTSKCVGMGRNGQEWVGMSGKGQKWVEIGKNGQEWVEMGRNGQKLVRMGRNGYWVGICRKETCRQPVQPEGEFMRGHICEMEFHDFLYK